MSKRGWGKFVAFAAVTGAVAAGVSYVLQYRTYHSEPEKGFREFEGNDEEADADASDRTIGSQKADHNYISLSSSKDEFKVAAKDMASATKNVLKDAGSLLSDTAHEAISAAVDTAHTAIHTMKAKRMDLMDERGQNKEDDSELFEDEGFLDDDYVDEDDLYDYSRMDGDSSYPPRNYPENYSDDLMDEEEASVEKEDIPPAPEPTATIKEDTLD